MPITRTLLLEGPDDEHVLKHICGSRKLGKLDKFKQHEGVDRLLEAVPTYLKAAGDSEIVGVIVDADTSIDARWQSLRDRLCKVGYVGVPIDPVADGTILNPPEGALLPRVGIWIMPDNQTPGILEHFVRFLIPNDSGLFDHVKTSVASIPLEEVRFTELARPKALIHTWLAWQEEPGKPLGTAITARYLDPNVPEADTLALWLQRLYFS